MRHLDKPAILSVTHLKRGETAKVLGYGDSEKAYRQKLLSMGLTPGTEFTLSRVAPLGDPIQITVRGYALSLRKQEALAMQIEKVGHE
jgi:ferrous iron transport protein A